MAHQGAGGIDRPIDEAANKRSPPLNRATEFCAKYGLKLWNKTIKTYKDVSQFWTYDEKKFLEQPVYSRDYPPLKG